MNRHRHFLQRAVRRQRGISLAVSLVLLLVVTLVAMGSMRGVVLQARMSGTAHDRNLSFQAAEVALRAAERRAATATSASFPASGAACADGYCPQPAVGAVPRWMNTAFADWLPAVAAAPAEAVPPEAIVEDMGDAPNWLNCDTAMDVEPTCLTRRYLVSARSTADGRASVLVQSQFAAP